MISPSWTKNVLGAQLTLTQPVKSLPLNKGIKPSLLSSDQDDAAADNKSKHEAMRRSFTMVFLVSKAIIPRESLPGLKLPLGRTCFQDNLAQPAAAPSPLEGEGRVRGNGALGS